MAPIAGGPYGVTVIRYGNGHTVRNGTAYLSGNARAPEGRLSARKRSVGQSAFAGGQPMSGPMRPGDARHAVTLGDVHSARQDLWGCGEGLAKMTRRPSTGTAYGSSLV